MQSMQHRAAVSGARGAAMRPQAVLGLQLPGFSSSKDKIKQQKAQLLEAIKPLRRGLTASEEQKQRVDELCRALEKANPTREPLASSLLNGAWELQYTTSDSILGTNKPAFLRPQGPIYQIIDATTLSARNKETWPLFNQVSAELIPESKSKVKVQFKEFKLLGLLPIKAPPSAQGELAITYLDDDLRISRGNRGNLFVLTMNDRDAKP